MRPHGQKLFRARRDARRAGKSFREETRRLPRWAGFQAFSGIQLPDRSGGGFALALSEHKGRRKSCPVLPKASCINFAPSRTAIQPSLGSDARLGPIKSTTSQFLASATAAVKTFTIRTDPRALSQPWLRIKERFGSADPKRFYARFPRIVALRSPYSPRRICIHHGKVCSISQP